VLTGEGLYALLSHRLEVAETAGIEAIGYRPCAVFDADGTLWAGDLTTSLVQEVLAEGAVRDEARAPFNALLTRYGEPPGQTAELAIRRLEQAYTGGRLYAFSEARGIPRAQVDLEVWPSYNWVFSGWKPDEVQARARALWARDFHRQVFVGLTPVIDLLRAHGLRVVVVSAALEPALLVATSHLGFDPADVRGMRSGVSEGRLTPEIEPPVLFSEGKLEVVHALCGGRPLAVFGDSVASSDAGMLEDAWLAVAVEPRGRHLDRARDRAFPVVRFASPRE